MKSIQHYATLSALGILLMAAMQSTAGAGRQPSWQTPSAVSRILSELPNDLSPTFSAPRLLREPEYSIGTRNTLNWPADSIESALTASGWNLLFYEIQARFMFQDSTIVLWGFVDTGQDSVVFTDLPEGVPVEYRLRYYTRNGSSKFGMSYWSDAQVSIQDAHPPVLETAEIIGLQRGTAIRWVTDKNVALHVKTIDAPAGRVMKMAVCEKSATVDDTMFFDIVPPKADLDTVFSAIVLKTPERESVTLIFWVADVSGQSSTPLVSVILSWIPKEETRMFCFPNPFNPSKNEISVIKVLLPEALKARIFDPFGNLVRILQKNNSSDSFFEWDGRNQRGDLVSNGGYLCVVEGHEKLYCKIAVLR